MEKFGKANLSIRLIGATLGAVGFYLSAFDFRVAGAVLVGLGGVLLALGS